MRYVLSILLASCCLVVPTLHAQTDSGEDVAQLKARIALLEERLARLEARAAGGVEADPERAAGDVEADPRQQVQRVVAVPSSRPGEPSWTEVLSLDGDLRYRHETVNDDAFSVRHRHRIRARANATARLGDNLEAGFGLSTGGTANDSGNQTLDEGFSRKSIGLDLAYFDWRLSDSLAFVGGKMSNPFFRPGSHHLLYDGDLRPEGLALKLTSGAFFVNASAFWAEERGSGPDSMWYGLQGGYRGSPARGVSLATGAGVHELSHARGRAPLFTAFQRSGQSAGRQR